MSKILRWIWILVNAAAANFQKQKRKNQTRQVSRRWRRRRLIKSLHQSVTNQWENIKLRVINMIHQFVIYLCVCLFWTLCGSSLRLLSFSCFSTKAMRTVPFIRLLNQRYSYSGCCKHSGNTRSTFLKGEKSHDVLHLQQPSQQDSYWRTSSSRATVSSSGKMKISLWK